MSLHSANVGAVGKALGVCAASATRSARHAAVLYSAEDVLIQFARALVHSREAKRVVLAES